MIQQLDSKALQVQIWHTSYF